MDSNYDKNVFINCPFDKEYAAFFRPLLFAIRALGFYPRVASERMLGGEVRLEKIKELILASKFSIHDLSRAKARKKGEYYRMNMSFELGLDLGCRLFHKDSSEKKSLIVESEPYSYQKALSDLSGSDLECYNTNPEELICVIRNWFSSLGFEQLESGSNIWYLYGNFALEFFKICEHNKFAKKDIDSLPVREFLKYTNDWLHANNHSMSTNISSYFTGKIEKKRQL